MIGYIRTRVDGEKKIRVRRIGQERAEKGPKRAAPRLFENLRSGVRTPATD
jgi:hypothetical protein